MKKLVVIAAALTAASGVQAATSTQKRTVTSKQRVANSSPRTRLEARSSARTQTVAAVTPSSQTRIAAVSERASGEAQTQEQDVQSTQSSATRLALPSATSTVQATKPGPKMIPVDNFKIAANVYYYGSSVASPLDSRVPDFYYGYQDRESGSVNAEVHFSFGYRFHPNYTFSLNPQFAIAPSASKAPGDNTENTFMKPIASYARLNIGTIASYKNMKWNGDIRLYPGATDDLHGTPLYFRTGQNLSFTLSKSTSLAIYNTFRYYVRTDANLENGWDAYQSAAAKGEPAFAPFAFRFTVAPAIEHQFSEKVGMAISFNIDQRLAQGASVFAIDEYYHEADGPYIEAGTSLDLIPNLNLNPYVDVYTRRPNFYGTRWGINVGWTIL